MISIIISSANAGLLEAVSRNIEETIGLPYELIAIDNSSGGSGICEIYNRGVRRAKYDLLCFMHEDIRMRTPAWGRVVAGLFDSHATLGLVGVAGSSYKAVTPSGWHCGGINLRPVVYLNIFQFFKFTGLPARHDHLNPGGGRLEKVASIDGVWFCTRRHIALERPFDETLLKGFHGYDIDFSINVGSKYEVAVTFDVLLEHFSEGHFGREWFEAVLAVHRKWASVLPVNVARLDEAQLWAQEKRAFRGVLRQMRKEGYSAAALYSAVWDSRTSRIMRKKLLWVKLLFFVFKLTMRAPRGKGGQPEHG